MKKFFVLLALVTLSLSAYAAITLADNGKTVYTIVAPENPSADETAAVKDLKWHLDTITGADFRIGKAGENNIYVGRKAPADQKPLKRFERRVRSEGGNIYLYGSGRQGNTFAVYDFLERYFGCRWYSMWDDMKIPKRSRVIFRTLNYSIVPSFNHTSFFGNIYNHESTSAEAFRRRARIYDIRHPRGGSAVQMLGSNYPHMPERLIPPGRISTDSNSYLGEPLKYFKKTNYFLEHPEYFSFRRGRRLPDYQLCYSNPGLRKQLIANYERVIQAEYKGGEAKMYADLNDRGKYPMPCCWCEDCTRTNKKYGDNAGSYWDFIAELGEYFLKKYPDIRFQASIYQITREVPRFPRPLPSNITLSMAPLDETDFLKPYSHGSKAYDMLKAWSRVVTGDFNLWGYPTVYPRPLFTLPLVANIHRMTQNMRDVNALGVNELELEFGCGPSSSVGFNELRLYLISRLSQNIKLDEKVLIKDFMENFYGKKAAPVMLKYYRELEAMELNEKNFMRWWPDHRSCLTYLTPSNIMRWQGYFDRMLRETAPGSRHHLNIRRARINLDEATMSIWYKFAPGQMPDRDMLLKRHQAAVRDSYKDKFRYHVDQRSVPDYQLRCERWSAKSIDYHYALAGKWKELPEPFRSMKPENILRTVPYINRRLLTAEPESATGLAIKGKFPRRFNFTLAVWSKTNVEERKTFKHNITPAAIKKAKPGYNFYYMGTTRLYPDSCIYSHDIAGASGILLGYLYDPAHPRQKYDIYYSLKLDKDGSTLWFDQAVLVKSRKKSTVN